MIKEFTLIFDSEDMSRAKWLRLSKRLESEIKIERKSFENQRYKKMMINGKVFSVSNQDTFTGIVNYLRMQNENEINVTASSTGDYCDNYLPKNVTVFDDQNKFFYSRNEKDSWLCYDFIKHKVIPTDYSIRTYIWNNHLKNWVIECSNDKNSRRVVDEQQDCSLLNGKKFCPYIQNEQENNKRISLYSLSYHWARLAQYEPTVK